MTRAHSCGRGKHLRSLAKAEALRVNFHTPVRTHHIVACACVLTKFNPKKNKRKKQKKRKKREENEQKKRKEKEKRRKKRKRGFKGVVLPETAPKIFGKELLKEIVT